MKSSIIPKEEIEKYNVENFFENISNFASPSLEDKLFELSGEVSEEEVDKINKLLEAYFLRRNQSLELSRKFKDFFDEELKKSQRVPPSKKFVDFLISKKISGSIPRRKSSIIDDKDLYEIKPLRPEPEKRESDSVFPKIIRNEQGEITGIEVKCSCGEVIHIDIEFE